MDLNDLLSSIGLQGLLGYGDQPQQELTASQIANQKLRSMNYEPMNFASDRPMMSRPERNPSDFDFAMMPYMGAPMPQQFAETQGYLQSPISLQGGLNTFNEGSLKGVGMGSRLGAELPLDEKVRMALGVSGGGQDITYAMGTPYEGRSAKYDITGIDATIRDLAKNREFGAEIRKAFGDSLMPSVFYRQRF
jgi:hypothetical protein